VSARQLAHFGSTVRDRRKQHEPSPLSQRELARRTGLSPTTISELEQGQHEPKLGTLLALRDGLGLGSIEELLGTMPSVALSALVPDGEGDRSVAE
jgi:transcriptional regulator with XRE-family HTH domain